MFPLPDAQNACGWQGQGFRAEYAQTRLRKILPETALPPDLANALKQAVLPGEELRIFLAKEGKEQGQAIGYLDDGTMVVVENGKRSVNQTVPVTVTSVLQTSAGRMIFAKMK